LDEIDAIGDREQFTGDFVHYSTEVVNALLEHLDGSIGRDGVIVVGACNRPDRIDRALLRSGRLEKHVFFGMPDETARKEILGYYLPEIAGSEEFDKVSRRLEGWSHADLNRLSRDAKKTARRAERQQASIDDLCSALPDKQEATPDLVYRFAAHEAGHAVCALALGRKLDYISISREFDTADKSGSLGVTMLADNEPLFRLKADITDRIAIYLAGIAAEEVLLSQRSVGGAGADDSDLARATELAYSLVSRYGLGRRLTIIPKGTIEDLRRDGILRAEVEEVLREQYDIARTTTGKSIEALREIAAKLVDNGRVSGDEALRIFQKWRSATFELSALLEP
jgi:ATP-dependent Zn protease